MGRAWRVKGGEGGRKGRDRAEGILILRSGCYGGGEGGEGGNLESCERLFLRATEHLKDICYNLTFETKSNLVVDGRMRNNFSPFPRRISCPSKIKLMLRVFVKQIYPIL